ncbi:phosphotransferase family protein [Lactovum miscens]|uniref:Thiamine kinase-like enzyme n=1 Tax=Lactovum miscens TaxID=190387 RepID=A0A841C7J2_9LACT|nr:phosphotransferase family protein [Lactovum miscens]MBB5888314.1 thiamine kinase-like enzyme [Lactovum miscens]
MLPQEPSINWQMRVIDSSSGNSYMGEFGNQRVFIKLNASPLLPSLSTEGIVPKIQWIRKTDNGETLTAQSWVGGHSLSIEEMAEEQVYDILKKLHGSHTLRDSLSNFDRSVSRPSELLAHLLEKPNSVVATNTFLSKIASEMLRTVPILNNLAMVVVHGNVSPDNWLKDESTGKIYLIDWKTVSLGDAYIDNAFLLSHYIPSKDWGAWLAKSGDRLADVATLSKLIWYGKLSFLRQIDFYLEKGNTTAANAEIQGLRRFMEMFE